MHEWVVHTSFMYHRTDIPEAAFYKPSNIALGANFAFFAYCFIPVAMEKLLSKVTLMKSLGLALPQPMKTFLVLMTTLPFEFWFLDPYFHGRLFLDYEGLMFTIFKIE